MGIPRIRNHGSRTLLILCFQRSPIGLTITIGIPYSSFYHLARNDTHLPREGTERCFRQNSPKHRVVRAVAEFGVNLIILTIKKTDVTPKGSHPFFIVFLLYIKRLKYTMEYGSIYPMQ